MADITISYKGNTIAEVSASGTTTLGTSGKYCEDDISVAYVKPSGTVSQPSRDVNFYDYDGTIVASYSASDFANLFALPDNPSHEGLTAQGWNWTLADAKAQVLVSGHLDIGQMYVTTDGKTRLYITITSLGRSGLRVYWSQSVASSVTVDWGDGNTTAAQSGTGNKSASHTYSSVGDYVITLTVSSGTLGFGNGSNATAIIGPASGSSVLNANRVMLTRVEIGSNVTSLPNYAFYDMYALRSVSIPNTITSFGNSAVYSCNSLPYLTVPTNCVSFSNSYEFRYNYAILYVSLPMACVNIGTHSFRTCSGLRRIALPPLTTITDSMLQECSGLSTLVIPSTVTSIGASAFYNNTGMAEYHVKATTPPTLGTNAFYGIPSDCKIYVPSASLASYQSSWSAYSSYLVGE